MREAYGTILLVERDQALMEALATELRREGLETLWARTAAEAEAALATHPACLIILDLQLVPEDAWQVYRRLRRFSLPIMLLSARPDPAIRRLALTLGADDCVVGAIDPDEVAVRARFVLQRAAKPPESPRALGQVALDPALGGARVGGRTVSLTRSEYALLAALIEAQGRVVPREQLVVRARGHASALPLARSVEFHIRTLRRKLGDDVARPRLLLTVRGFGYRLAGPYGPSSTSLMESVFEALPEPAVVLDPQRHVKLMNRAAAALVGQPSELALDDVSCAVLFGCQAAGSARAACAAQAALATSSVQCATLTIRPRGEPLEVEETVTPLPVEPTHLLVQFRERPGD